MDYTKRCRQISNSFYNLGLEKAQIRDLSGAAEGIKKSLHFNKYQTDARNLLGLIYYEMGETAEALVQWVISSNLQPQKNRAVHYLHEIQDKPGRLEAESVNIKKYNQGLFHAQNGSDDLAILQLSRVVENNPHFIKAHLVLALLYIAREDYTRAGKSLYKVLQIDKNNPKALWYMSIVKSNTGRAEVERRKLTNAFSHRQMQDDDIIIPPTYKEITGWQTIINIMVGLALGAAVVFFMAVPAVKESLNTEHNHELARVLEQVSQKNLEITGLEDDKKSLESQLSSVQDQLNNINGENQDVVIQYQRLVQILQDYRNESLTDAAKVYTDMQPELITDAGMQEILASISADMTENGYQLLAAAGDQARDAGNTAEAADNYQRSLKLKADNPAVIYSLSNVYQAMGQEDQAKELWGQLIMNFPDTEEAALAKTARGY